MKNNIKKHKKLYINLSRSLLICLIAVCPQIALSQSVLYTFSADTSLGSLGTSLSAAGDVNKDGIPDIIAGDEEDSSFKGKAKVFSGADGSTLHTFSGNAVNDSFGFAVAGGSDINGDGYDDLIVGAYNSDANGTDSGQVKVFSGVDGSILHTLSGGGASNYLGYAVCMLPDMNADSRADFATGAIGVSSSAGQVRISSGSDASEIHPINGGSAGDDLGISIASMGDLNGDGKAEIIVGAVGDDTNGSNSGKAYVYSGSDYSELFTFNGASAGDLLGHVVANAGDVNADGKNDFLVSASLEDTNGVNSGCVKVYSGENGALLYDFCGDSAGDQFGHSAASAGDVNADGYADIIVGAPLDANTGANSGSARIFSGKDGSTIVTINGTNSQDRFGYSVAGVGDLNDDGLDEIAVGAPDEALDGKTGVVRVYSFASFDFCPEDSNKLLPGECGCGVEDTDVDENDVFDCKEENADERANLQDKISKLKKKIKKQAKLSNSSKVAKLKKRLKKLKKNLKKLQ